MMNAKKAAAAALALAMAASMSLPVFAEETTEAESEPESQAEMSIEPCEIEFWHAMSSTQEEELTALTDEFNETNEYGITVKLVNQGNYSDLSTKLTASAASDTLPDLAQTYNNWMTDYIDKVVPLDDFIEAYMPDYDDIIESYRDEVSEFGFVSGMPFNKSTYVYFYNKTMFDELGIEAPKTWEDMATVGAAVLEGKGIPAFGVDDLAGFLEASLLQDGAEYIDETGALFDNDKGLETLTYIMDLYNNGYARLIGEDGYFSTVLSNQLVGGYIGSVTGVSYITADGWELGVAPLPSNETSAANQAGTNIAMFSTDENKQLAGFAYMMYLTSTEATTEWAEVTGYLPVRVSAYESDEYQEFMANDPTATAAYAQADYFFASKNFDGSYAVRSDVNSTLEDLILDGADGQTALDTLVEAINSDLE